jgi:hypothetical protein
MQIGKSRGGCRNFFNSQQFRLWEFGGLDPKFWENKLSRLEMFALMCKIALVFRNVYFVYLGC